MKTSKLIFSIPLLAVLLIVAFSSQLSVNAGNSLTAAETATKVYLPLVQKNYAPDGSGYGNVTGYVTDARTGAVIVGAEVCWEGMVSCPFTNADGKYTLQNVPNGTRKLIARDPAGTYLSDEELVVVLINTTVEQDFRLLRGLEDDQMRVKVTWDDAAFWPPSNVENDLNLHMWWDEPPYGEGYQRVDIDNTGYCLDLEVSPYACYENDERQGSGPDTIAFQYRDSVYYYFAVLNYYADYLGVPSLKDIVARTPRPRVEIFEGTSDIPIQEIEIDPNLTTGDGDLWYVFKLELGDKRPILQNCLTQFVEPGDVPPNDLCATLQMIEKLPEQR